MSSVSPTRVADDMVAQVKLADGMGFYTWGIVSYKDAFGEDRYTKFAHVMMWHTTGKVDGEGQPIEIGHGRYLSWHNEAD
jgi:hypothetical protein